MAKNKPFLSDVLADQFMEMFGNSGVDAFELEWGFAKFLNMSITSRESKWIQQIYAILLEKGHNSQETAFEYNDLDCHAWIHDIEVMGCKSIAVTNQNRGYVFTVECDGESEIQKRLEDFRASVANNPGNLSQEEIALLENHYKKMLTPKVHIRRFYEKKGDCGYAENVTDERKGNKYPHKVLLKSMHKGSYYGVYEYMDLRDTGYVWSTGDITPRLSDFGEVKYACGELNGTLTCLSEEYNIKVDFNFIKGNHLTK